MLTFFDYLRQRAFESVLAGAQEALDVLEKQQDRGKRSAEPKLSGPSEESPAEGSTKARKPASGPSTEGDDPLPPPRRRGRPGAKGGGGR